MEVYATDRELTGWLVLIGIMLVFMLIVMPLYNRYIKNKEHKKTMARYQDDKLGGWD